MRAHALVAATAALGACASAGSGALPADVVRVIATARQPEKFELATDATGAITKVSVSHHAEAEVPESVRRLVAEKLPGATVKAYESEWEGGARVFEVEVESAEPEKKECELSATADGTLRYVECRVEPSELPAPVAAALAAALPGAEVQEAERKQGPALDVVSVEAKSGGRLHYFVFKPSGEMVTHQLVVPGTLRVPAR